MWELTVEELFSERAFEIRARISNVELMSAVERKRYTGHVIADLVQRLMSKPGTNLVGLAVTVTLEAEAEELTLLVVATCPHFETTDAFFFAG